MYLFWLMGEYKILLLTFLKERIWPKPSLTQSTCQTTPLYMSKKIIWIWSYCTVQLSLWCGRENLKRLKVKRLKNKFKPIIDIKSDFFFNPWKYNCIVQEWLSHRISIYYSYFNVQNRTLIFFFKWVNCSPPLIFGFTSILSLNIKINQCSP